MARDFSIHYENMGHSPPQRKQIKRQLTQEQRYLQAENRYFRALADYLHLLKQWKEECAPKQVEDVWHPLFMEALKNIRNRVPVGYIIIRHIRRTSCRSGGSWEGGDSD